MSGATSTPFERKSASLSAVMDTKTDGYLEEQPHAAPAVRARLIEEIRPTSRNKKRRPGTEFLSMVNYRVQRVLS
jgi:hypothetical protein